MTGITHGSLFSGIGGFDYAGELCGIKTLWVCEIEPAPVAILRRLFPDAIQLGNIMEVHGGEIAPVDVLTFGSPCQGMSVAGTRCGLDSDQSESVLFYEAVRIIYEMREATNGEYPKIIIWENVPGAYSSNKGMDFRAVLETLTKSTVPMPKSGRWATSGMVRGGAVDIAWRTPDAQYWGVPQRRKRIKLIGDFTGGCAAKLLFECDRLSGYFAKSREQRQGTAADTEDGTGTANRNIYSIENHANDSRVKIREDGTVQTLTQRMGTGGGNVPMVLETQNVQPEDKCECMTSRDCQSKRIFNPEGVYPTLQAMSSGGANNTAVIVREQHTPSVIRERCGCDGGGKGPGVVCAPPRYIVRRLTPMECERLQGFPDGWTEWGSIDWAEDMSKKYKKDFEKGKMRRGMNDTEMLKKMSDTVRYKGLGNAVDIPTTLAIMATVNEYLCRYYGKE